MKNPLRLTYSRRILTQYDFTLIKNVPVLRNYTFIGYKMYSKGKQEEIRKHCENNFVHSSLLSMLQKKVKVFCKHLLRLMLGAVVAYCSLTITSFL